jgi:hypothetical protein
MKRIWKYIRDKVMSFDSYSSIVNGPFAPKENLSDKEVREIIGIIEQGKEKTQTTS